MSKQSKSGQFLNDTYDINVLGRNVLVTDAMKDYAIEKISKIDKFSNRIIEVHVTMDIQKIDHRVDILMKVDHIKIKSSASSEDMYASIDLATDKLHRRLLKYKKRIQEHSAKPLSIVDMNVNVIEIDNDEVSIINDEIESETNRRLLDVFDTHKIVSQETRPLKLLTTDEAVMKLELSGDKFLIFRCEEDQHIKVMYERNDGNFGLIEVGN